MKIHNWVHKVGALWCVALHDFELLWSQDTSTECRVAIGPNHLNWNYPPNNNCIANWSFYIFQDLEKNELFTEDLATLWRSIFKAIFRLTMKLQFSRTWRGRICRKWLCRNSRFDWKRLAICRLYSSDPRLINDMEEGVEHRSISQINWDKIDQTW